MDSSGRTPRSLTVALAGSLALFAGLSACSRPTGDAGAAVGATATTERPSTTALAADTADAVAVETTAATAADTTSATGATPESPPPVIETVAPISVVDVAEEGTPGLDSDDAFCAAWSRFAGSFQVVAVTAAFGSGPPDEVAALEVAASPVVAESYDALFEHWPDELETEREIVADQFLGPFHRRLDEALNALVATGADADAIDAIEAAWVDGLARRDPSTPEFTIDLPDALWTVIDDAADAFSKARVPFGDDPSLATGVSPPLTTEYLTLACPDQGALSGQEVDAP